MGAQSTFVGGNNLGGSLTTLFSGDNQIGGTLAIAGTSGTSTIAAGQGFTIGNSELVLQQGSGNVGIGTTLPQTIFTIAQSTNGSSFRTYGNGAQSAAYGESFINSSGTYINQSSANYLITDVNSGNGIYLRSGSGSAVIVNDTTAASVLLAGGGGNVGIGTTSPYNLLTLYKAGATAANSPQLVFSASSTVSGLGNFMSNWAVGVDNFDGGKFKISSSSIIGTNDRFVIDGSGNVGVGTTTPQWLLNPFSSSASQLALSAGGGIAQWAFRNAGGNLYLATTTVDGTATSSTSALTIMGSSGNIGINTATTPQTIFTIAQSSNGSSFRTYGNGAQSAAYGESFINSSGTYVNQSSANYQITNVNTGTGIYLRSGSGSAVIVNDTTAASVLLAGGGGNVGIGTTSPWAKLSVAPLSSNTAPLFAISTSTVSATSTAFIIDRNGNVGIGTTTPAAALTVNGSITPNNSTVYTLGNATYLWNAVYATNGTIQTSDVRLRDNIASTTYGLDQIMQLRPVSYTWKAHPEQGTKLGFIAQEVQPILPETVTVGDDANHTMGLTYTEFIPVIVRAIQQLAAQLSDLAATVASFADHFTTKELVAKNIDTDSINANSGNIKQVNTDKLCVGSACITESQLAALLASAGQSPTASGSSPSAPAVTDNATTTPPVITINGENPAHIKVGDSYADLGATITGPQADLNLGIHTFLNGTLASDIVLDTSTTTTDTIDYVVTDGAGLTSTSTRTVFIEHAPAETATSTPQ